MIIHNSRLRQKLQFELFLHITLKGNKNCKFLLLSERKVSNVLTHLTPSFTDCAKLQPLCASFTDGFGFFLDAIAKAKKLILKSIAQNLKRVSLTKSFLALAMAFNLLLSNPT